MQLSEPIIITPNQVKYVLGKFTEEQYTEQIKILSETTTGQHARHIKVYTFLVLRKESLDKLPEEIVINRLQSLW